jgi:hypothetical protein
MPERIEIVERATGRVWARFGRGSAVTARARLLDVRGQLAEILRARPYLRKFQARDLEVRRVDIYDDETPLKDDAPDRVGTVLGGLR